MKDYKETLNLPGTSFPMKANLPNREPEILKFWDEIDLYKKIRKKGDGKKPFLLLDGPPYANGKIHIGHALNKVLKDFIIKSKTLFGYDAPYLPGWDCHGLPIEHQVEKKKGKVGPKLTAREFRDHCREYALKQVEEQKEDFIRLGVPGEWENPYLTLDKRYEAEQIRAFAEIYANNHVTHGHKPVHWCLDCQSALAEAEVEYMDKVSTSVDVLFKVIDTSEFSKRAETKKIDDERDLYIPIWTTTPWTLPSNEAVAMGKDISYGIYKLIFNERDIFVVIANDLKESIKNRWGVESLEMLEEISAENLLGLRLQHPFDERTVPVLLGEHVTTENGTGSVHTAPAHGQEDFQLGIENDLDLNCYVNTYGVFIEAKESFAKEHIFKSESNIIEKLSDLSLLISSEKFEHSYPHCWRHKTPVIYRTTKQWFISMENQDFRNTCLNSIKDVDWKPTWGEDRINGMIETRPDWCISRQRYWGVPIPLFTHKDDQRVHPDTLNLLNQIADKVEDHGIDAWFDADTKEFLGDDADSYEKSTDTMDVWMDSGIAHKTVSRLFDHIKGEADLYLEGSDQHRGWFQSSLLTSVAINAHAPYKEVLTHGFVVDEKGHKMSKSLGNTVSPQSVINNMGADILRLWVASTDYSSEMKISDQILKRNADTYRRIRNTARFLLSNLSDFDPSKNQQQVEDLVLLDQLAIQRVSFLNEQIKNDYNNYSFHKIIQLLHNFCVNDMGGFYLDILKDRLYTMPSDSSGRRSAQTALYIIAESLTRWIAPILSFTSEEIWKHLPDRGEESVFLSDWLVIENSESNVEWDQLNQINAIVLKALEVARDDGEIGSPLDAHLEISADQKTYDFLTQFSEELRFLFITSSVDLEMDDSLDSNEKMRVKVKKSKSEKCGRCWHRQETVGGSDEHPEICARCISNIGDSPEERSFF
tara:strand:- start:22 stop:2811 length:2790 start_codon:yes stop_codon:yes gene_type:complete